KAPARGGAHLHVAQRNGQQWDDLRVGQFLDPALDGALLLPCRHRGYAAFIWPSPASTSERNHSVRSPTMVSSSASATAPICALKCCQASSRACLASSSVIFPSSRAFFNSST